VNSSFARIHNVVKVRRALPFVTLCVAVMLVVSPSVAQQSQGRVGAFSLPNSPWDVQWQRFISNVEKSGLKLDYFIRGEIGSEETMLAALKRNRLQVGGVSLQGIASVVPEINVAMSPFLFRTKEEVDHIYDTVLLNRANVLLEPHGIVLLRWLESGWFSIGAQTPIRVPSHIKGLKIGGSPNVAIQSFLVAVGADAIPVASVDLVQALQTGLVDGAIKPTALIYSNLREDVESVALLEVTYDTGALLANKRWFDGLRPEYAHALQEGHGPAIAVRQEVRDMVTDQIKAMNTSGKDVIVLNETERSQWERVSTQVHQDIVSKVGGEAQSVYDEIERALRQYRNLH
jgi:TRAP-type C4-dicarboxylate transport system substrate-binding protein